MSTRITIQPYMTAGSDAVIWGGWQFSKDSGLITLDTQPPTWDPTTELWVSSSVKVHKRRFLEQTGLLSWAGVSLVASVESPQSYFRGIDVQPLLDGAMDDELEAAVRVHLPSGSCFSKIQAKMLLVLTDTVYSGDNPIVAKAAGSRLARSGTEAFNLDPQSPLFPTEALAFSGLLPAGVPWFLSVIYDDLNDAFYGAVRLFVNTEHPGGQAALAENSSVPAIRSSLRVDVVRSLFQQVAVREGLESDANEYAPDSVGAIMSSMSLWYFRLTLRNALQLMLTDPVEFESRLQAALEYMRGV